LPAVDDVIAGRYLLLKRIGAGGMGEVWLARHRDLGHQVALKCALVRDETTARRMRSEGRKAARLSHPNVVGVHDVWDDGPVTWLVMEYVESVSLAQKARDEGLLTPDQAAAIGAQIADALAEVHAEGLVHGDVTPENILVKPDGTAKLTDFGIARALWGEVSQSSVGGLRGKFRYLAPEVARGEGAIQASDMFMLGAALYMVLEGQSPLGGGDDPFTWLNRSREGRIELPTRAGRLTGPITALLRVAPEERPRAAEFRSLLTGPAPARPGVTPALVTATVPDFSPVVGGGGSEPTDPLPTDPLPTGRPRPWRRRPVLAAAAAVVVAGAVAGLLAGRPWDSGSSGGGGSPGSGGRHERVAVMGDPRTADPCSLLSASALARFGDTYQDAHYANFDRCDVLVQAHDDDVVDAYVTLAGKDDEPGARVATTRTGKVTVAEEARDSDYCVRTLTLADGYHVEVTAHELDAPAPDICAVADAASGHAAAVLNHGPVGRRPPAPTRASLVRQDACTMLGPTALGRVPGMDARRPERDFGDWGCRWDSATSRASVHLRFDQGQTPDPEESRPVRLGGRQAFVTPGDDGPGSCLVQIVHREFESGGDRVAEMVKLDVFGTRSSRKVCDTAEALGTDTATRLPRS
jgi:eukaryotic-like serine/threonine-protein kinase